MQIGFNIRGLFKMTFKQIIKTKLQTYGFCFSILLRFITESTNSKQWKNVGFLLFASKSDSLDSELVSNC